MNTSLQQGKYLNGFKQPIIIAKRTEHEYFWYSTQGYWYEADGRKALPKPLGKTRPYRQEGSSNKHDLDLSSFTPLSPSEYRSLFPGTDHARKENHRKTPDPKNSRNHPSRKG